MAEQEIKVGDIVVLKSEDNPRKEMTVGDILSEKAMCYFWKDGSVPVSVELPLAILKVKRKSSV